MDVQDRKRLLHLLAASERDDAVHFAGKLLERGEASARMKADDGLTPLHVAAYFGRKTMCQLLLNFGADPLQHDAYGRTPLSMSQGDVKEILRAHIKLVQQSRRPGFTKMFSCHRNQFEEGDTPRDKLDENKALHATANPFSRGLRKIRNSFRRIRGRSPLSKRTATAGIMLKFEGAPGDTPKEGKNAEIPQQTGVWSTKLFGVDELSPQPQSSFHSYSPSVNSLSDPRTSPSRCGFAESTMAPNPVTSSNPLYHPMKPTYYDTPEAKSAGLYKRPSAPPLSTTCTPKQRSSANSQLSSHSSPKNSSDYFTAEDVSFSVNELKARFDKAKLSDADEPRMRIVMIDDGEMRRIKGLKDIELRVQLRDVGIIAGPICVRTRRLYEKKLYEARKEAKQSVGEKYSKQLEMALKGQLSEEKGKLLNEQIRDEFSRSGVTAFCYILYDPRALASCFPNVTFSDWITSIFYIGKGTKLRPLQHLIDTKKEREVKTGKLKANKKLKRIDSLWSKGYGVGRLEIGHGISDEEAFVIEAALIDAIGLNNLTNLKSGEYHGLSRSWDPSMKAELGVHLLYRSFASLHAEGIRVVHEDSLPGSTASNGQANGGKRK